MFKMGHQISMLDNVKLTSRKIDIIGLLVAAMNNKLTASKLNISDVTVEIHIKNALLRAKVNFRLEAAIWAINHSFKKP